jgi:hypothetical protein
LSTSSVDEDRLKAVEKVLGEPAFSEFAPNAWKIRTNLIVASAVSIAVVFADLHIDPGSTVLGLKFHGLNDTVLVRVLFGVTLYLLLHFIWSALDSLPEWRLRVTGTRVAFVTTARLARADGDYPRDPRQSTFYHWWKDGAQKIGNLTAKLSDIEKQLQEWDTQLKVQFTEKPDAMNIVNATDTIRSTREAVVNLERSITKARDTISALRVPVSLRRFDRWFHLFLRSQNLRWLIMELGVPILVGSYALVLLWNK